MNASADPSLLAAADEAFRALDRSLTDEQRSWLERISLARGIDVVDSRPAGARVTTPFLGLREVTGEATSLGGDEWLDRYLRLLLLALLVRSLTRPTGCVLPDTVAASLAAERRRIVEGADAADADPYKLDGPFVRDLGFCLGTILPLGVYAGQRDSSIPAATLERAGLVHLRETPWLNLHLDIRPGGGRYTAEAREYSRLRIADFLRENPSYQGMFGVSWLTDPAATEISPHLMSSRQELIDIGIVFLRLDTADDATVRLATATSTSRRRRYEEGEYAPTEYMTLWPREAALSWSVGALQRQASRMA